MTRRKTTQPPTRTADGASPPATGMLALATVGFAVAFWAWALLAPLGATLREQLSRTAFQQYLVVAVQGVPD